MLIQSRYRNPFKMAGIHPLSAKSYRPELAAWHRDVCLRDDFTGQIKEEKVEAIRAFCHKKDVTSEARRWLYSGRFDPADLYRIIPQQGLILQSDCSGEITTYPPDLKELQYLLRQAAGKIYSPQEANFFDYGKDFLGPITRLFSGVSTILGESDYDLQETALLKLINDDRYRPNPLNLFDYEVSEKETLDTISLFSSAPNFYDVVAAKAKELLAAEDTQPALAAMLRAFLANKEIEQLAAATLAARKCLILKDWLYSEQMKQPTTDEAVISANANEWLAGDELRFQVSPLNVKVYRFLSENLPRSVCGIPYELMEPSTNFIRRCGAEWPSWGVKINEHGLFVSFGGESNDSTIPFCDQFLQIQSEIKDRPILGLLSFWGFYQNHWGAALSLPWEFLNKNFKYDVFRLLRLISPSPLAQPRAAWEPDISWRDLPPLQKMIYQKADEADIVVEKLLRHVDNETIITGFCTILRLGN